MLTFEFPDGEAPTMHGEVIDFDPPRSLAFTWGDDRQPRWMSSPDWHAAEHPAQPAVAARGLRNVTLLPAQPHQRIRPGIEAGSSGTTSSRRRTCEAMTDRCSSAPGASASVRA